jgi:hypothetical protein
MVISRSSLCPSPRSSVISPRADPAGMLKLKAEDGPMRGSPMRLKMMRSSARPDRRARVGAHRLLVHDDGRGEVLDRIDVRARRRGDEALHEGRIGLVDEPPALGRDGLEDEAALARAADAREDRQLAFRDLEVDIAQVVLAGAADADGAPARLDRCHGAER